MSYQMAVRLLAEEVKTIAHGSILGGGVYMGVGTALEHPARMIMVQNYTDATLMFSLDGVTDNFPLIKYSHAIFDISSNKTTESGFYIAEGQRLYVTQIGVPTAGSVYLSVFYGKD